MSSNSVRRVPKACEECRSRKVRCDGRRHGCSTCERLGFSCSFQREVALPSDENLDSLPSRPQRLRARQACQPCHTLKARCSGESPSCQRCMEKGQQCTYKIPRCLATPIPSTISGDALENQPMEASCHRILQSAQEATASSPSKDLITRSLNLFFKHVHPLPAYAFLHKASLLQRYHAGQAEDSLLLSIIGITSRLCDEMNDLKDRGLRYVDIAVNSVLAAIECPTITKIQTLVLSIRYRMTTRNFPSAFMLLSIAVRMAFGLRLNYENPDLCFLAQESRRRLMWALYMLDSTWSAGLRDFTICPADVIHLQLPGTEEDFELDVSRQTASLSGQSTRDLSILAYYIRIMSIRYDILQHTRKMIAKNEVPSYIPETIKRLEGDLQNFYSNLPASTTFSTRNLSLRAYSTQLPRYVMLHIWWHQCHCDLFRTLTTGFRESVPEVMLLQIDPTFISYCQDKCVQHAKSIADIISAFLDLGLELPVMDSDIAVCSYQSIRIIFKAFQVDANKFLLSHDIVRSVAEVYLSLLKKFSKNSLIIAAIETDIENLIAHGVPAILQDHGTTSQHSTDPDNIPGISPIAVSSQSLSRHSLVRQSGFIDDSSDLTIAPINSRTIQNERQVSDEPGNMLSHPQSLGSKSHATVGCDIGGQVVRAPMNDWECNNAFQGAWDSFTPSLDPIIQLQENWGPLSDLQPNMWTQDFQD